MMHAVPSHDTMAAPVFLTPRLGVGRPRVSASRTEYALTTESMPILLPSLGWQGLVALDRPRSRPTAALDIGCCAAVVADIGVGGLLLRRRRDGLPMTSPDVGWQVPNRSMSVPPPNRSATRRTTSACADCAPAMPREAMLNVAVLSLSMRRDVAAAVMPVGPTSTRDAGRPQASAARTEFALATESLPILLPIRGRRGLVALDRLRRRPAVVPDIGCCAAAEADDVAGGLLLRRSCDGPPMASTDAGWRVPIRSLSVPQHIAPALHRSCVTLADRGVTDLAEASFGLLKCAARASSTARLHRTTTEETGDGGVHSLATSLATRRTHRRARCADDPRGGGTAPVASTRL